MRRFRQRADVGLQPVYGVRLTNAPAFGKDSPCPTMVGVLSLLITNKGAASGPKRSRKASRLGPPSNGVTVVAAKVFRSSFVLNAMKCPIPSKKARVSGATPPLVVSDVHMPGASGLDVLHWLRRWLPGIPTILMSAFADPRAIRHARALGASAVLRKPFDLAQPEEQADLLANR